MNYNSNPVGNPRIIPSDKDAVKSENKGEFDRFADLTGKLVSLSKDEVDERRKAEA